VDNIASDSYSVNGETVAFRVFYERRRWFMTLNEWRPGEEAWRPARDAWSGENDRGQYMLNPSEIEELRRIGREQSACLREFFREHFRKLREGVVPPED
jgi:hypothetical protein